MKKILKLCAVLTVMFFVLSCFVACSNGGGSSGNPGGGTGQEDEATDDDENNEEVEGEEDENYTFSRTVTVEMTGSSKGYGIRYNQRMKDENGNEKYNYSNPQTKGYFCPHPDPDKFLWAGYVEKENYYMVDMYGVKCSPVAKVEIDGSTLTVTILDSITEKIQFSGFRIRSGDIHVTGDVGHVSGFWDPVKGFYYETTTVIPGLTQKTTRTYGELKWVEE